jgi:transcription antitermination factor NusG
LNWFAIYTFPRAEKKIHAELVKKGITAYLPLLRSLRQWSDRKKWVEEPLFRSYIFVHISDPEYFKVLNTPGVVRFITFEGRAVPVPEQQIEAIRYYLSETETLPEDLTVPDLLPGTVVEVTRGPLKGLTGQLVDQLGQKRVRIEIDALGQYLNLTISQHDLRAAK